MGAPLHLDGERRRQGGIAHRGVGGRIGQGGKVQVGPGDGMLPLVALEQPAAGAMLERLDVAVTPAAHPQAVTALAQGMAGRVEIDGVKLGYG